MRAKSFLLALFFAVIGSSAAHAYKYTTCNALGDSENITLSGNSLSLRSSTTSFPAGYWRDGLNNTISQFNKNPSPFRFSRVDDSGGVGVGNGQNEVWGSTTPSVIQGYPAVAYTYRDCYWFFGIHSGITEGDTVFNYGSPWRWTATRAKSAISTYTGTLRMLQGTGVHEFGHVTGLKHENRWTSVMGSDFTHLNTSGSTVNAYVGEDTGNGLVALYGLNNSGIQDLAMSHWRFTGASGEYSTHGRTRVFSSGGSELGKTFVGAEPRYNVTRGATVKGEFSYENLGRSTQNGAGVKFYISTNEIISSADTQIRSISVNLARNTPALLSTDMVIPAGLTAATDYWLGVIITTPAGVADGNSSNNTSYIRIRTN